MQVTPLPPEAAISVSCPPVSAHAPHCGQPGVLRAAPSKLGWVGPEVRRQGHAAAVILVTGTEPGPLLQGW